MKKNEEKFKSVRYKLFITLSIVTISIIAMLILTNSIILESFYTYSKVKNVKKAFNEVNSLYNNEYINQKNEISKIATENNFDILIETENEVVMYTTNSNFVNMINQNKDIIHIFTQNKDRKKLIYAQSNMIVNKISIDELDYILLSGNLDNGYKIYIQIPIATIQESVNISNNVLLLMGLITIIIAAIAASVISKRFTSPILELNIIANKMSKLDFSQKYRLTGMDDEINELGNSINIMSDKLETIIKQLRNTNNELEKDIEEKSKIDDMRKQFISDVSHELKTPIALIQGYSEGLLENVNVDEQSRKYYAEVILDESNKMDRLVRQLLELMKIENGKRDFNNKNFNICELINEVIRKCNVIIQEKKVEVKFDSKKEIEVFADDFYIEQAFTNYLTNAIKHVKEIDNEKEINVRTKILDKSNKVRVYVFNTGDNISEDNIKKIWGRFFKVDISRNRDDGGTGIGLSLVKAIMNNYKSEYGVINKENGVEFYFDVDSLQ